jgi:hypothetical protein
VANPRVVVDFVADTTNFRRAADDAAGSGSRIGSALKSAVVPATAALAGITAGATKAVQAASNLNEQISASQQVFGKGAGAIQAWAKTGAQAFGLSQTEALKAANAYGNMFSTIGLGASDTANMSKSMVQLAGDMASFHDQDPTEMLDKLRSGLSGEAEPLRQFGVLISDAAVKQEAYRKGIAENGAELTEAQKVQARYALIMEQTTKAHGDFGRTAGSVANQQRTLAAENQNVAASFGQALLPVTQSFMGVLRGLLTVISGNRTVLTAMVATIAALAAVILTVNAAVAAWNAIQVIATGATKAWAAAQWLINAALTANPIGLVVVAIAALIAALIVAYKTSDTFRRVVDAAFDAVKNAAQAAFNWVKANWPLILGILTGPLGAAVVLIVRNWDRISDAAQTAVSAVKSAFSALASWLSGAFKATVGAAAQAVGNAFDFIADGARDAYESVKRNLNGLVAFIESIIGKVSSAANAVASGLKKPINAVISAWNSLQIPRVSFSLPRIKIKGKTIVGGQTIGFGPFPFPDIPTLATGGVVSDPTLALIGEGAGREIVAPESLLREIVGAQSPQVRVFIGDTELRGIVRAEIVDANTGIARTLLAGA